MKYIVYIKENGRWYEQGDGTLTFKQASRIAAEIYTDFRLHVKVLPADAEPPVPFSNPDFDD